LTAVVCVLAFVSLAKADDKPNPTGTWRYTVDVGGQSVDVAIKLKLDGDKLTGAVVINGMEKKIEDGKYKEGAVSFKEIRTMSTGKKVTIKYSGQVKGDTLKCKREADRDGQISSREFEAKRSKD
jgi:hypothetical protein